MHRAVAEEEIRGNLAVGASGGQQAEHLDLAWRQTERGRGTECWPRDDLERFRDRIVEREVTAGGEGRGHCLAPQGRARLGGGSGIAGLLRLLEDIVERLHECLCRAEKPRARGWTA